MIGDLLNISSKSPDITSQEQEFLKAFDEYSDALFRHAIYRLSDRERAIELVHDTYIKVWAYVRSGKEVSSYRPFLYKILGNLIIDEYRKKKDVSLDDILGDDGAGERYHEELHEGSLEELTFALDAKKVLEHLPHIAEQYREAVTLRFIDGLGPKEISSLVEVSENVVSLRIHRGLVALRTLIQKHEEEASMRSKSLAGK